MGKDHECFRPTAAPQLAGIIAKWLTPINDAM
jgi:hypothetical protein